MSEPGMRLKIDERMPNTDRTRPTKKLNGTVHLPPAARKRTDKGTVADVGYAGQGTETVHWSGVVPSYVDTAQDDGRSQGNVVIHATTSVAHIRASETPRYCPWPRMSA